MSLLDVIILACAFALIVLLTETVWFGVVNFRNRRKKISLLTKLENHISLVEDAQRTESEMRNG